MFATPKSRCLFLLLTLVLMNGVRAQETPPQQLAGHTASVNAAVYTPDQRHVLTAGGDHTVRLWDAASGKELRALSGHTGPVLSVASSPDSLSLVSGAGDNSLRIWDVPRADPVRIFEGPQATVREVTVNAKGNRVISFTEDGEGRLWNLEDGTAEMQLQGMTAAPVAATVRADGNQIAGGDVEGNLWTWETLEGTLQGKVAAHEGPISGLLYHPNNQQLISSGEDGLLKVWQLPLTPSRELEGIAATVRGAAVTSNGQLAVTGSDAGVWVHQMATGQPVRELTGAAGSADAVTVSPNNTLAAAGGKEGIVRLWNLADGTDRLHVIGHDQPIAALAFHPDNARFASAAADGTVRLWRLPTDPKPLAGHAADVVSVAVSGDGATAATASADHTVRLWNATTGQPLRTFSGHEQPLRTVAIRSDGAQVASGDDAGEVRLWNMSDGAVQGVLGAHRGPLRALAYAANGRQLATVGDDGLLKLWQLPVAAPVTFAGHAQAVSAAVPTADGQWVVTGSVDKSVRLFDASTGQQVRVFADVPEAVSSVALSGEGELTAVGMVDGVIKLWRTADGAPSSGSTPPAEGDPQAPSVLRGHEGAVIWLGFDAATERLVSAGADGTLRVWKLPTAPQQVADSAHPTTGFVVSPDGKFSAAATTVEGNPAVVIRDLEAEGRIVQQLLGHQGPITALAFQRDGARLVSGTAQGECVLWNLRESKFPLMQDLELSAAVTAVALSNDGQHIFASVGNAIHQHATSDGAEVRVLPGHGGAISALAVAGPTLFSAAADKTVRGWTIATGAAAGQMNQGAAVVGLAVSNDGKRIASWGADKVIKIWHGAGESAAVTLSGHAGAIRSLRFNADGSRLASVGEESLWLWDVESQQRLEIFAIESAEPQGVGFSGDRLVLGTDIAVLRIAPHLLQWVDAHPEGVHAAAMTLDGQRAITAGPDEPLKLWNLDDGKRLATFAGSAEGANGIAITEDGQQVIAGGADKMLRVWPMPAAAASQPIAPAEQWELSSAIKRLDLAADGDRVAIAGDDNVVRIWDLALGREREHFPAREAAISSVSFTPDGAGVVVAGTDNEAMLVRSALRDAVSVAAENSDGDVPYGVAFHPEGNQLFMVGTGAEVTRWEIVEEERLEPAASLAVAGDAAGAGAGRQVSVAIRGDGMQLASLDDAGQVHVWSMPDGQLAYSFAAEAAGADGAAGAAAAAEAVAAEGQVGFSGDQTKLIVARGSSVGLHAAEDGRMLQRWHEPAGVTSVAVTPDAATLVVGRRGDAENAVLREFSLQRLLKAHDGTVRSLAFSADGSSLLSGGDDNIVRLWSTADGALQRVYGGCEDRVTGVAITPDGTQVVAGGADQAVRIWPRTPPAGEGAEPTDPVEPTTTIRLPAPIRSLSVSPDNLKLAVAGEDGIVRVLDRAAGFQRERFEGHEQAATAVAFSADSKTLLSVSENAARIDTSSLLRAFRASEGSVRDIALAGGGAQAVTAAEEGLHQWNLANGDLVRRFASPEETESASSTPDLAAAPSATDRAEPVAFLSVTARADGAQLAAVDAEQNLVIWNLANGQLVAQNQLAAVVRRLRYSPDNQKLVALCEDDGLRFYDPADATLTYHLASDTPLSGVTFSADSRTVLTGGKELREWRYASPTAVRTLTGHGGPVLGITYSPSGRWIASASADQTVRIWDAETGVQVNQLSGHQGAVYAVVFSPDESLLVSCGAEKGLRVWDVLGGRQLKQLPVGDASLYTVTFLPDGNRVAAGGLERKIYIVNLLTGELQNTLEEHGDYLYRLDLNGEGTRLMSCGYGGSIRIWNAANQQLLFTTDIGHVANSADLAPDGRRVVVASDDGRAYFVDIPSNAQ